MRLITWKWRKQNDEDEQILRRYNGDSETGRTTSLHLIFFDSISPAMMKEKNSFVYSAALKIVIWRYLGAVAHLFVHSSLFSSTSFVSLMCDLYVCVVIGGMQVCLYGCNSFQTIRRNFLLRNVGLWSIAMNCITAV